MALKNECEQQSETMEGVGLQHGEEEVWYNYSEEEEWSKVKEKIEVQLDGR